MYKTITYTVEGMICGACANLIQDSLKKVRGIKQIQVDFTQNKAMLHIDNDYNFKKVQRALKSLGFELKNLA